MTECLATKCAGDQVPSDSVPIGLPLTGNPNSKNVPKGYCTHSNLVGWSLKIKFGLKRFENRIVGLDVVRYLIKTYIQTLTDSETHHSSIGSLHSTLKLGKK